MVNHTVLFRQWLMTSPELVALLGDRGGTKSIYAGDLPQKTDPSVEAAITCSRRGGTTEEEAPISTARIQVRVWAGINQSMKAGDIYGVLNDFVDGANNVIVGEYGVVISCRCTVLGQDVTDPDTSWATVVGFYELMAREAE